MKKPTPKKRPALDFSECTNFIQKKYKIQTRDFANTQGQITEFYQSKGWTGGNEKNVEESQRRYAVYTAEVAAGRIVERPYQDFWHWLIDNAEIHRGGTFEFYDEIAENAEPWVKQILGYYLTEFGTGPYLTDW